MVKVSASILGINWKDLNEVKQIVLSLEDAKVDYIHFDICDGKFVKQQSFNATLLKFVKSFSNLKTDVHLMVENPETVLESYIAEKPNILTVQFESFKEDRDVIYLLKKIKASNICSGVAITPETPVFALDNILKKNQIEHFLDYVLVLSVHPGKSGQSFILGSEKKVEYISQNYKSVKVEIDGGINETNAKILRRAGADILVSGNTIISSLDKKSTTKKLKGGILS